MTFESYSIESITQTVKEDHMRHLISLSVIALFFLSTMAVFAQESDPDQEKKIKILGKNS